MTGEDRLVVAVNAVLAVQLAAPLLLGLPMFLRKEKPVLPTPARRKQRTSNSSRFSSRRRLRFERTARRTKSIAAHFIGL